MKIRRVHQKKASNSPASFMLWKNPLIASTLSLATSHQRIHGGDVAGTEKTTSLEDFHRWADENKIIRSVEVSPDDCVGGGKGLIATRDLLPNEIALQVPRVLTIKSRGDRCDGNWAGNMAAQLCKLQDDAAAETNTVGSLNIEFAPGQFYSWMQFSWKPYLDFGLPEDRPLSSSVWTESQLNELQNATFAEVCRNTASWAECQYERFAGERSKDEFHRALALVCSRALEAGTDSRMLVPFLDNANHAIQADGGGNFHIGSGCVTLFAGKLGVRKGEPVTLDYGARSSDEYAVHYGFVPEKCVGDSVLFRDLNVLVSWEDVESPVGHVDPVVRLRCSDMLDAFPTSLDEDEELASSYQGGFDEFRVALSYRISKKKLLSKAAGR